MTKWMGLESWVGREMMRRLRFVVWEPKWVKETRCKGTFPIDNKEQYLRVLRLWSGQRAKGIKKLESDKDKAFPPRRHTFYSGILKTHVLLRFLTTTVFFAGIEARVCLKPRLWVQISLELLLHCVCTVPYSLTDLGQVSTYSL